MSSSRSRHSSRSCLSSRQKRTERPNAGLSSTSGNRLTSASRPTGHVTPRSSRNPRIWLITAVRRPTRRVRSRWIAWRSSCSIVFSGTNRIVGRWTASPIASASSRSFLCDLTNGFTYCGGISRTSCPSAIIEVPSYHGGGRSAVDEDLAAMTRGGRGRDGEANKLRHFFGSTRSTDGDPTERLHEPFASGRLIVPVLFCKALHHPMRRIGLDHAGSHRVHANALRPHFLR